MKGERQEQTDRGGRGGDLNTVLAWLLCSVQNFLQHRKWTDGIRKMGRARHLLGHKFIVETGKTETTWSEIEFF